MTAAPQLVAVPRCRFAEPHERLSLLTDRQQQVLAMIGDGLTTKQMAWRLRRSTKTVEAHRAALMDKLGVPTIAGLVRVAILAELRSLKPRRAPPGVPLPPESPAPERELIAWRERAELRSAEAAADFSRAPIGALAGWRKSGLEHRARKD